MLNTEDINKAFFEIIAGDEDYLCPCKRSTCKCSGDCTCPEGCNGPECN